MKSQNSYIWSAGFNLERDTDVVDVSWTRHEIEHTNDYLLDNGRSIRRAPEKASHQRMHGSEKDGVSLEKSGNTDNLNCWSTSFRHSDYGDGRYMQRVSGIRDNQACDIERDCFKSDINGLQDNCNTRGLCRSVGDQNPLVPLYEKSSDSSANYSRPCHDFGRKNAVAFPCMPLAKTDGQRQYHSPESVLTSGALSYDDQATKRELSSVQGWYGSPGVSNYSSELDNLSNLLSQDRHMPGVPVVHIKAFSDEPALLYSPHQDTRHQADYSSEESVGQIESVAGVGMHVSPSTCNSTGLLHDTPYIKDPYGPISRFLPSACNYEQAVYEDEQAYDSFYDQAGPAHIKAVYASTDAGRRAKKPRRYYESPQNDVMGGLVLLRGGKDESSYSLSYDLTAFMGDNVNFAGVEAGTGTPRNTYVDNNRTLVVTSGEARASSSLTRGSPSVSDVTTTTATTDPNQSSVLTPDSCCRSVSDPRSFSLSLNSPLDRVDSGLHESASAQPFLPTDAIKRQELLAAAFKQMDEKAEKLRSSKREQRPITSLAQNINVALKDVPQDVVKQRGSSACEASSGCAMVPKSLHRTIFSRPWFTGKCKELLNALRQARFKCSLAAKSPLLEFVKCREVAREATVAFCSLASELKAEYEAEVDRSLDDKIICESVLENIIVGIVAEEKRLGRNDLCANDLAKNIEGPFEQCDGCNSGSNFLTCDGGVTESSSEMRCVSIGSTASSGVVSSFSGTSSKERKQLLLDEALRQIDANKLRSAVAAQGPVMDRSDVHVYTNDSTIADIAAENVDNSLEDYICDIEDEIVASYSDQRTSTVCDTLFHAGARLFGYKLDYSVCQPVLIGSDMEIEPSKLWSRIFAVADVGGNGQQV